MRFRVLALLAVCAAAGCSGTGQSPSPLPGSPLTLNCPSSITAESGPENNAKVDFPLPAASGGRAPVNVTCTPASGSVFPLGANMVGCTASDAASQTATCSFEVNVTRARRLSATRFLAFGDSITEGYLRERPTSQADVLFPTLVIPSETYPYKLQKLLEAEYPSQTFTVINAGIGGETTAQGRARFVDTLTSAKPDVLLLLEGYNELSTREVHDIMDDLRAMARSAQVRDVDVVIATLFHVTPAREADRPGSNEKISALNDEIREIAAELKIGIVDLERAFGSPPDPSLIGSDGLHPNPDGYTLIAEEFFDVIKRRFEKDLLQGPAPSWR